MIEALALLALGYLIGGYVGLPSTWGKRRRTVIESSRIAMALYGRKRGR